MNEQSSTSESSQPIYTNEPLAGYKRIDLGSRKKSMAAKCMAKVVHQILDERVSEHNRVLQYLMLADDWETPRWINFCNFYAPHKVAEYQLEKQRNRAIAVKQSQSACTGTPSKSNDSNNSTRNRMGVMPYQKFSLDDERILDRGSYQPIEHCADIRLTSAAQIPCSIVRDAQGRFIITERSELFKTNLFSFEELISEQFCWNHVKGGAKIN